MATQSADIMREVQNSWVSIENQPSCHMQPVLHQLTAVDFSLSGVKTDDASIQSSNDISYSDADSPSVYALEMNHMKAPDKSQTSVLTVNTFLRESDTGLAGANVECVVCGDKSSGKHYGQFTCEGCKSFFKRSVRRNLNYTCRGNMECPVDPKHRNQCQFCRLKKCIRTGMKKEAVQRGRINQMSPLSFSCHQSSVESNHNVLTQCYMNPFISVLMGAEPYPVNQSQGSGNQFAADSIYELAARLLFAAVEWARNLPFFSELAPRDQVLLLRSSWTELFILNTAQCALPLHLASMLGSNAYPSSPTGSMPEHLSALMDSTNNLQYTVQRLRALRLDLAEFACLKAMLLFCPDNNGLLDVQAVENIQEKCQSALDEYLLSQYPNQPGRLGKLLLRLPPLKAINANIIEQLFFVRLVGKTPIDTLIRDMLLGGNSFSWPHQNGGLSSNPSAALHPHPC